MSGTRHTSRVFVALRAMKLRLQEQEWPAHPITGELPQVALSNPDPAFYGEIIQVVPVVEDDEITDRAFPNYRGEVLTVQVSVQTFVDVATEDEAFDRLELLAEIVQRSLFEEREAPPSAVFSPLDFDGADKLGGIERVSPVVFPTPEGFRGSCDVFFRVTARI